MEKVKYFVVGCHDSPCARDENDTPIEMIDLRDSNGRYYPACPRESRFGHRAFINKVGYVHFEWKV